MLSINLSELFLTIASFFLLYFLLKIFLFEPVMKFMDERQARIDKGAAVRAAAHEAVAENERLLEAQLSESREEAQRLIAESRAQDEASRRSFAEELHSDSIRARQESEERAEALYHAEAAALSEQLPALALLLAEKILSE